MGHKGKEGCFLKIYKYCFGWMRSYLDETVPCGTVFIVQDGGFGSLRAKWCQIHIFNNVSMLKDQGIMQLLVRSTNCILICRHGHINWSACFIISMRPVKVEVTVSHLRREVRFQLLIAPWLSSILSASIQTVCSQVHNNILDILPLGPPSLILLGPPSLILLGPP